MALGIYGFRKNGIDKVTHFHPSGWHAPYDNGRPEVLGKTILQYCQRNFAMDMVFDRIEIVDPDIRPTQEELEWYIAAGYCDASILDEAPTWYRFLKDVNDINDVAFFALAHGRVSMANCENRLRKGLFRYVYIINLDTGNLEYSIGEELQFPHVHLLVEFPIKEIVAGGPDKMDDFVRQMQIAGGLD